MFPQNQLLCLFYELMHLDCIILDKQFCGPATACYLSTLHGTILSQQIGPLRHRCGMLW